MCVSGREVRLGGCVTVCVLSWVGRKRMRVKRRLNNGRKWMCVDVCVNGGIMGEWMGWVDEVRRNTG